MVNARLNEVIVELSLHASRAFVKAAEIVRCPPIVQSTQSIVLSSLVVETMTDFMANSNADTTVIPPIMNSDKATPINVNGYSKPLFVMKKCGQCTATIAVNIAQQIKIAPIRVNRPRRIKRPPINSPSASAASQSHAGRKGNGTNVIHLANPGPAKVPNTFCAPWAIDTIPRTNLDGNVDHVANVAVNLLSIVLKFLVRGVSDMTS